MTPAQFAALAELLRLRSGAARDCARLVLVDGMSTTDAARAAGIEYTLAHKAVKRVRRGLVLVMRVHGVESLQREFEQ